MKIEHSSHFQTPGGSLESACGTALLGRLGRELAHAFGDCANEPLPPKLRLLIERLDVALSGREREPSAGQ